MLESRLITHIEKAMAGAAPKSKAQEITARMNDMAAERAKTGSINDWAWRLLKKDVEAMRKTPALAPQSLLFEAIVWSLASNVSEMERCFNIYAGQYGKDWPWYRARAMQGPALGRTDMVIDMLESGYPEGSASDLRVVAHVCNQSGLFISSAKALDKCLRLDPNSREMDEVQDLQHLPETVEYMLHYHLDEKEISRRIAVATQVVIQMSGPLTTFSIHTNESGITFEYTVDAAVEQLAEIDFAITRKLIGAFDDTMSRHMSIGVAPRAEDEILAG
jgi:hypothetical protein